MELHLAAAEPVAAAGCLLTDCSVMLSLIIVIVAQLSKRHQSEEVSITLSRIKSNFRMCNNRLQPIREAKRNSRTLLGNDSRCV